TGRPGETRAVAGGTPRTTRSPGPSPRPGSQAVAVREPADRPGVRPAGGASSRRHHAAPAGRAALQTITSPSDSIDTGRSDPGRRGASASVPWPSGGRLARGTNLPRAVRAHGGLARDHGADLDRHLESGSVLLRPAQPADPVVRSGARLDRAR